MQLIIVSSALRQARTLTLSWGHAVAAGVVVVGGFFAATFATSYFVLSSDTIARLPSVERIARAATERDTLRTDAFVRENINALAVKLGEMQAHLTRLDTIGERVVSLAGLKTRDLKFGELPGRGGPAPEASTRSLSLQELARELEKVSVKMDHRGDTFKVIEEELVRERARQTLLPSSAPVDVPYQVSGFGWRIDPFSGRGALHEGIDFAAPMGTPILAAAGGIVVDASFHPAYGNLVDLDHGNGLTTRYAHASKLSVKVGEVVKRGQKIAEVGSTGHSTGPHLHFEVRQSGAAQNPSKFLSANAK
jgi:murein DD-endopeptidase MepM/ murein hydrolase activator NlpD